MSFDEITVCGVNIWNGTVRPDVLSFTISFYSLDAKI